MKTVFVIFLFLLSIKAYNQTDIVTDFYPLTPIDTITNSNELKLSERIDGLKTTGYFFTYQNWEFKNGLLLTKKRGNIWIIYKFDSDILNSANMTIDNFSLTDPNLISIRTSLFPSGACSNSYSFLTLLNIETLKTIEFCSYNLEQCYNKNGDISSQSQCSTKITIKDGIVTLNNTGSANSLPCSESAGFKIENDKLIKTEYYLARHKSHYPVMCNEEYGICTGMSILELKRNFSAEYIKDVPASGYGYASEEYGLEISSKEEPLFFAAVNDNIVTGVSFKSPKFNFNGIHTGTKISEIFVKYPNSILHIDLLSGWEYIIIKEPAIKFIFTTDTTSRIGIYKGDNEDGTKKISKPDAKVDFIQF